MKLIFKIYFYKLLTSIYLKYKNSAITMYNRGFDYNKYKHSLLTLFCSWLAFWSWTWSMYVRTTATERFFNCLLADVIPRKQKTIAVSVNHQIIAVLTYLLPTICGLLFNKTAVDLYKSNSSLISRKAICFLT